MKKTQYVATIFDGHSHIERRGFENENGERFVRINGLFFKTTELKEFDVNVWYNGNDPVHA
jgi:hypothetical protein